MSSTSSPLRWWHLADLLKKMNKAVKANEIEVENTVSFDIINCMLVIEGHCIFISPLFR